MRYGPIWDGPTVEVNTQNQDIQSGKVVPRMDRRSLLIGGGLTAMAALSFWRKPTAISKPMTSGQFGDAIPDRVEDWVSRKTAEVVLPPQDDSNKLYENLETRIYEATGLPAIMLLVAYSSVQQNDIQVHRPEVCYPASGFPIISEELVDLRVANRTIRAKIVRAQRGGMVERVLYWVRVGDQFPTDWPNQRLSMALANLKGVVPDGVLVRVSALEEPSADVSDVLQRFTNAFLAVSPAEMRNKILL